MKSYTAFALALVLCFVSLGETDCAAQQVPPGNLQPLIEQLDKAATELVKKPEAASVTVGLVNKNGLVWARSYGYAEIGRRVPANTDSVYRIGSITKQFTAVMLLQLVHQGKVHLSDPVEKYFPEIRLVKDEYKGAPPITLLQLVTHRSGLDNEPDSDTFLQGPVSDWEKILIMALPHTKYIHEPGRFFSYSNIGYAILGAALARAAQQPYTAYVKEKILQPLGMTHSDFEPTSTIREHLAAGYDIVYPDRVDSETPEKEHAGRGYKVPNGALYTTVGDLAKFEVFEMLGGPESVLPKENLEETRGQVFANADLTAGYGLGFQVNRVAEHVFIGHSGSVAGYMAMAYVQPQAGIGIVILRNENAPGIEKLLDLFMHKLEVK